MKQEILNDNILNKKVLVKLWDNVKSKWYFKVIDVKKEEKNAIISYNELIKRKSKQEY